MKSLLLAASAVSMLALAVPAMAQNPYDGAMHNAPDNGPQMRFMESHDSTVLDRTPYAGNDAYSDQLSNQRIYFNDGPGLYMDR